MIKRKMKNKILTIGAGTTILLTSIVLALGTPHAYAQSHGFSAGLAARNSDHSSLEKSSTPFPCAGGTGVEYCSGYHDGAVQADRDDAEMSKGIGSVDVNKHLPCVNSIPDYCRGFIKGYDDEADDILG
jgi:hypothetical protein